MNMKQIKERKEAEKLLKEGKIIEPKTCYNSEGDFYYDDSKYGSTIPRYTKFKIEDTGSNSTFEEKIYDISWAKKAFNEYLEDDDLMIKFDEEMFVGLHNDFYIDKLPTGEEIIVCSIDEPGGEEADIELAEDSVRSVLNMYGFNF